MNEEFLLSFRFAGFTPPDMRRKASCKLLSIFKGGIMSKKLECYPWGSYCEVATHVVVLPDTTEKQRRDFLASNPDLVRKRTKRRVVRTEAWIEPPEKEKVTPK